MPNEQREDFFKNEINDDYRSIYISAKNNVRFGFLFFANGIGTEFAVNLIGRKSVSILKFRSNKLCSLLHTHESFSN